MPSSAHNNTWSARGLHSKQRESIKIMRLKNSTVSLDPPQLSICYFDLSDLMWLLDATQATHAIKVNKFVVRKTRHSLKAPVKSSLIKVHLNRGTLRSIIHLSCKLCLFTGRRRTSKIWNILSAYFSIEFDRHQLNFRTIEKEVDPFRFIIS